MLDTSSRDSDVIHREIATSSSIAVDEFSDDRSLELEQTAEWIKQLKARLVALQFPDSLLGQSWRIVSELESRCENVRFFVLADTTVGSCCVDFVAAQHAGVEAIVHYGKACLTRTCDVPVHYVFGRRSMDVGCFSSKLSDKLGCSSETVVVLPTFALNHMRTEIEHSMKAAFGNTSVIIGLCGCNDGADAAASCLRIGPFSVVGVTTADSFRIVYIGDAESIELTLMAMEFPQRQFIVFDPEENVLKDVGTKTVQLLRKRYFLVQKIKDCQRIGIVAATTGTARNLEMIQRCKQIIAAAGRKYYMLVVGKINAAKLGNFADIEAFVMISCPQTTIVEGSDYYQPIATPFELEIALSKTRQWDGSYLTDFEQILSVPLKSRDVVDDDDGNDNDTGDNEDGPGFSLITGKIRNTAIKETANTVAIFSPAADFLQSRTFKGLDPTQGESSQPAQIEPGRTGIAWEYGSLETTSAAAKTE